LGQVRDHTRRVTEERPHGLSYTFTLHAPDGKRLIGFDNAHRAAGRRSGFRARSPATDHWHRTEDDPGRPYPFKDAEALIEDFFNEVERVLGERGIGTGVVDVQEARRSR
jgi:hypothetical protein